MYAAYEEADDKSCTIGFERRHISKVEETARALDAFQCSEPFRVTQRSGSAIVFPIPGSAVKVVRPYLWCI